MSGLGAALAAAIAAVLAALGLGGGSVLLLTLTLFFGVDQLKAQGLNLMLFIPTAVIALCFHIRAGLVHLKQVLPAALPGILGAAAGSWLAARMDGRLLGKLFAGVLLIIGIREVLARPRSG